MAGTPINLEQVPLGADFEEFVAAHLAASGLYVDLNVVKRDKVELMQLDVLGTDYDTSPPKITLIEAKSGVNWGSSDIFKLRGHVEYMGADGGALVVKTERVYQDKYVQIGDRLNVALLVVDPLDQAVTILQEVAGPSEVVDVDVTTWRWLYKVERYLRRWAFQRRKEHDAYQAISDYDFRIANDIFFTETPAHRARDIYSNWLENRNLAAKVAVSLSGGDVDEDTLVIPQEVFKTTFYDCTLNAIQAASLSEHAARLAVFKAAVDYQACEDAGVQAEPTMKIKIPGGEVFELGALDLPQAFREAVASFAGQPYYTRYPMVWRTLMGPFGGFFLLDHLDEERARLAAMAGLPVEELDRALEAYNTLFPVNGGWFQDVRGSQVRLVKLTPSPVLGVGANYRRLLYADDEEFSSLGLTGPYTLLNLVKWNNAAVELLRQFMEQ